MAIENKKNGMNRCPHCGSTDTTLDVKTGDLRCNFCRSEFKGSKTNAYGGKHGRGNERALSLVSS